MAEQQRFITEDLIYVTRGCCPDCPLMLLQREEGGGKVPPGIWQRLEEQALAGGHYFECTSVTIARMQGRRLPYHVCCYGYFYQHWTHVDALSYAVEQQHIRYLDITGWQSLSESHYILYNTSFLVTDSIAESGLPFCPTEEWEAAAHA